MGRRKTLFIVLALVSFLIFIMPTVAAKIFGPGTTVSRFFSYTGAFIFLCYWLSNVSYIIRKNFSLYKKLTKKEDKEE